MLTTTTAARGRPSCSSSASAPPGGRGGYRTGDLHGGLDGLLDAIDRVPLARAGILRRIRQAGVGVFSNDDSFWKGVGSNPRTHFQEAYWRLGPHEAMIIEVAPPPRASLWSVGVTNFWMESLDFRYFPINLNSHSVRYRRTAACASSSPARTRACRTG